MPVEYFEFASNDNESNNIARNNKDKGWYSFQESYVIGIPIALIFFMIAYTWIYTRELDLPR